MDYLGRPTNFPMGGVPLQSPNPSQYNSADSVVSTDSFRTQVPNSYYQHSNGEQENFNTPTQITRPWATPDLEDSPVTESFPRLTTSLNPASSPYVPSKHAHRQPPAVTQGMQVPLTHANAFGQDNSSSESSLAVQPYQQGAQIGQIGQIGYNGQIGQNNQNNQMGQIDQNSQMVQMPSYQNANPYPQLSNMTGGPVPSMAPSVLQQHYSNMPYGPISPDPAVHQPQYSAYGMQGNPGAQFAPMQQPMNNGQNFQGMPYPSGMGGSGANQQWGLNYGGQNMSGYQHMGQPVASYGMQNQGMQNYGSGFNTGSSMAPNFSGQNVPNPQYMGQTGASYGMQSGFSTGSGMAPNFSGQNVYNPQHMGRTGSSYNTQTQGNGFGTGPNMLGGFSDQSLHMYEHSGLRDSSNALQNQGVTVGTSLGTPYKAQNQNASHFNSKGSSSGSHRSNQSTIVGTQTPGYKSHSSGKKSEFGGLLHASASKFTTPRDNRTPSPSRNAGDVIANLTSQTRRHAEAKDSKMAPTPSSRPRNLGLDFYSEPRKVETPLARSRRGQSVTFADPAHKATVVNWLESTPPVDSLTPRTGSDLRRRTSPPKMLNLLAAGTIAASNLKTINEGHLFSPTSVALPGSQRSMDPFAPMQAMVPYSNPSIGPLAAVAPAEPANTGMSAHLRNLTSNGTRKPTITEALDPQNLPFAEICRLAREDCWGVVRIRNIPYSVNRPEVLAFLGRNAKIVAENDNEPIHIIMERVTSKTLDCYVEFVSFNEAVAAVNRFETNRNGGRSGRLGQRHVDVELSSQEHLMMELFPKAKNVSWKGASPTIIPTNPNDIYNSGFQGFVTREEFVMLVKHVESPQRSPFSKDCPQRPFECLISTLLKYPWHMVDYITIEERNMVHKATVDLLTLLVERVQNDRNDPCLTPMLLKRVWKAALKCHGFTPAMKDDIVFICQLDDQTAIEHGVAPYAPYWKYLWTIGPKPGVSVDVLLWYIAIIRESTEKQLSLAEQAAIGDKINEQKLFGDLEKHLNFPGHLSQMSLGDVARIEWSVLEMLLRQALGSIAFLT